MAVAFKTALGNIGSTTAGSTIVINTTAAIAIGDLVVIRIAADNLSATTPTVSSVSDTTANSYTTHRTGAVNATGAAGVMGALIACKATAAVSSGTNITVTLSGSVTARSGYAESFTGVNNTTRSTPVGSSGASGSYSSGTSGAITSGDLILGFASIESRGAVTGDSDATSGTWSTSVLKEAATSGTDQARVEVVGQYKIATGTTTLGYDATGTNTDWVAGIVVLQQSGDATVTPATISMPWVMPLPLILPHSESGTPATISAPFAVPAATASGGGGGGSPPTISLLTTVHAGWDNPAVGAGSPATVTVTSPSITPGTDCELIMMLSTIASGTAQFNTTTVVSSGSGPTWTLVESTNNSATYTGGSTIWKAAIGGSSPGSFTVAATYVATTTSDLVAHFMSILKATGHDTATPTGGKETTTNQASDGSVNITLDAAPGANDVVLAQCYVDENSVNRFSTFGTGTWTTLQDGAASGHQCAYNVGYRSGSTSTTVNWSDVNSGVDVSNASTQAAIVVKAGAGGGGDGTATPAVISTAAVMPAAAVAGGSSTAPAAIPTAAILPGPTEIAGSTATPAVISTPYLLPGPSATGSSTGTGSPATISRAWTLPAPAPTASSATAPATIARAWTLPAPALTAGSAPAPATIARAWTLPAASATGGGGGGGGGAVVQLKAITGAGTVTFDSSTTTGNKIIVAVWKFASDIGTTDITDSKSNTYTRRSFNNAVAAKVAIFESQDSPTMGASHAVTVTGGSPDFGLCAYEVSGLTATPFDKEANSTLTGTAPETPSTGTLAQATEWVVAVICPDFPTDQTITPDAAQTWTQGAEEEHGSSALCFNTVYKSVNATTALTAKWALSSSVTSAFVTATFKASAAGPGTAAPATISAPFTLPAASASGPANGTATPATIPSPWTFPAVAGIDSTVDVATIARAWLLPAPSATGSTAGTAAPATISRAWLLPAPATSGGTGGTATPATIARAWLLPAPSATGASAGTGSPATITAPWLLPAPAASGSVTAGPATIVRAWLVPAPAATGSSAGTATPATIARAWLLPAPAKVAGAVATPLKIQVAVVMGTPQAGNVFFINITFTALSPVFARPPQLTHQFTTTHTAGAPTFRVRRPSAPTLAHDTKPPVLGHGDPDDPTVTPRTTTTRFTPRNPGPPTL